jgi:hypothetical protein
MFYTSVGNRDKSINAVTMGSTADKIKFDPWREQKNVLPLHSAQTASGAPPEGY